MSVENLVFFLEEISAREMLKIIVPKIIPETVTPFYFSFEGKQDLEKNIAKKMKNWLLPNTAFIIMRDKDSEDCLKLKERLVNLCLESGKAKESFLVRIACPELESFYLGDIDAVKNAGFRGTIPSKRKGKFNTPDLLNGFDELHSLTNGTYQKVQGSKAIAPFLSLDGSNKSTSFNMLISGIRKIIN